MRVFLTGATGFVGGRLARLLVQSQHHVTALVRDPARAGDLAKLGIELRPGDVTDAASIRRAMQGAEAIFHVAGWYRFGGKRSDEGHRINVVGTRLVLEAMRDLEIPRGVYTSTLAVFSDTHGRLVDESYRYDGPHLSEYDRTKWLAHYTVAEPMMREGLPLVIVQPGVVYGPGDTSSLRQQLWLPFLQGQTVNLVAGTAYTWAHIEDIARGHLLALERGRLGESYILAGPPHTATEAIAIAEEVTGIPARRRVIPARMAKAMAGVLGWAERLVPLPAELSSEYLRENAGTTYLATAEKARRELGYNPRPLREGLSETLEHERQLLKGVASGEWRVNSEQ